jgi:hypothetical protein
MLFRTEDDSGEGSVPELVSADESDTSSGESDSEPQTKPDMPDLVDEDASDSNESGIDEVSKDFPSNVLTKGILRSKHQSFLFYFSGICLVLAETPA